MPGTIFEEFGFNYVGPIDGHDLDSLIPTLENLRDKRGPQFLHIVTRKGQGYKLAEADPVKYHAASGKFDPLHGFAKAAPGKPTFTQVFGQWLYDMAEADPRLIGITPAMREGSAWSSSEAVSEALPRRRHRRAARGDVCRRPGLRRPEAGGGHLQHVPAAWLRPNWSTTWRIQNLPVVFALDRGGIVGADGPTHKRRLRHRLPALHPEHERADAGRRERMPPAARPPRSATTTRWPCATRAAAASARRSAAT